MVLTVITCPWERLNLYAVGDAVTSQKEKGSPYRPLKKIPRLGGKETFVDPGTDYSYVKGMTSLMPRHDAAAVQLSCQEAESEGDSCDVITVIALVKKEGGLPIFQ